MTSIYIGVGSNLGDRKGQIVEAVLRMTQRGIRVRRASHLCKTDAVSRPGETMPGFLNGVLEIETGLAPDRLLSELESVERELGRNTKGDWAPRTIDLDILFYGDQVYESRRLKIPHPEIERRRFVLEPMAELNPGLVHPILKRTMEELCNSLSTPRT